MTLVEQIAGLDWQSGAALAIVGVAAFNLARRAFALFTEEQVKGCAGGCSGCPASSNQQTPALVTLDFRRPAE